MLPFSKLILILVIAGSVFAKKHSQSEKKPTGKPVGNPISPTGKPISPTGKPIAPTGKPIAPTGKPIAPTGKPIAPTGKPISPTGQPIAPTGKPIAPSEKPFSPSFKPISPSSKPVSPSSKPVAYCPPPLPICQYAGYCRTDSDCVPGNKCRQDQMPYYSQCVPNPASYQKDECIPNYYGNNTPCTDKTKCCDPGAYCNSNSFRQCQQPALGSVLCLNPKTFPACPSPTTIPTDTPTDAPTKAPAAVPTSA